MPLRSAHGKARNAGRVVVIETSAADELPTGVPAADTSRAVAIERTAHGQVANHSAAAALGALGGRASAERRAAQLRMIESFGLQPEDVPREMLPYLDHAEEWAVAEVQRIAREVGGGVASPSVAALVQQAGLALAHSRHATADGRHGDAVRYGAEVRANILAAHELAAREAKARGAGNAGPSNAAGGW